MTKTKKNQPSERQTDYKLQKATPVVVAKPSRHKYWVISSNYLKFFFIF